MIPFTQFLRPNGRARHITIALDAEAEFKAREIMAKGFTFEIEELSNGQIHATISDEEDDRARTLVWNGPRVPGAIRKMIMEFKI